MNVMRWSCEHECGRDKVGLEGDGVCQKVMVIYQKARYHGLSGQMIPRGIRGSDDG